MKPGSALEATLKSESCLVAATTSLKDHRKGDVVGGTKDAGKNTIECENKLGHGLEESKSDENKTTGSQKDENDVSGPAGGDPDSTVAKDNGKRTLHLTSSSSEDEQQESPPSAERKLDKKAKAKIIFKKRRKNYHPSEQEGSGVLDVAEKKKKAAGEDRRKRKPSEGDEVDGLDTDFPKRLKQGSSDEKTSDDESSDVAALAEEVDEKDEVTSSPKRHNDAPRTPPAAVNFVDLANCRSSELLELAEGKDVASTIVDITRGHDLITNALPSSLQSSQEDLTALLAESESVKPEINDLKQLRSDQKMNLKRAKALIAAAFSEEESEAEEDQEESKKIV